MSGPGGVAHALFAIGGLVTLLFMVHAGQPGSIAWFVAAAPFAAWALLPFALGGAVAHRVRSSRGALVVMGSGGLLLLLATAALLHQTLVATHDAQSGLVFVFLPLWQVLGLLPFIAVAIRRHRTKGA